MKTKILIIAPHPDDEVLGCGGTIKKYSQKGDEVCLCIVTKAYAPDWSEKFLKKREKEIIKSKNVLGIKKIFYLGLPTVKLDTIPQKKLNDLIASCFKKCNPDLVFIPHGGDINKDHRLVFEAAMVATRPKPGLSVKKVLCYETLSETEWPISFSKKDIFIPNFYVDISKTIKVKLKAMACYETELKKYPHPRSLKAISILAQKRGTEAGLKMAEAFMLIREISR
jgi:N-acetylglucosamine malate deacetylase 1